MEPQHGEESSIESLKQKLYTPGEEKVTELKRARLHEETADVPLDWQHEHATPQTLAMSLAKHHTKAKWLFGVAILFFLGALGAAVFFLTNDRNIISAEKIDMTVTGPVSISAGDPLPLAVEVTNYNAATLEIADLVFEFPKGTRSAEDVTEELTDYRASLGDIPSGSRVATATKAVLFGEEGSTHDINITLEYRLAGSNAIFVKESVFTVTVGSTPLSLTVSGPRSINSGSEVAIDVDVTSNTQIPMENVVVRAEYPFGFTFAESEPETTYSDSLWALGDIEPEGKRTITIRGTLEGQQDEDRIFRFELGVASKSDSTTIGTSFVKAEHEVTVERPFIDLVLTANGSAQETVVVGPGTTVRGTLTWRNNLPVKMSDAIVEVSLGGVAFDEANVSALNGFYDSAKNTIRWDKQDVPALAFLDPGTNGEVSFAFTVQSAQNLGGIVTNPEIPITARITALPVGEDRTTEKITSEAMQRARVVSTPDITAVAHYADGPFTNTGPLPPKVEEKTTYTITWVLTNSTNELTDGVVSAVLPQYVSWENEVSPNNETVTYTASSRTVSWKVGTVQAGVGYTKKARTASFKIGLTPSATLAGTTPILAETPSFFANDTFVGGETGATGNVVTTFLEDLSVPVNHSRVVE